MDERQRRDDEARGRWLAIQALRIGGGAMVVVGLLIANGNIPAPQWSGYLVLALGLADVFFVPTWLARKWRTPDR
ncbi:MAG TPA: hypothetical protein VEB68_11765 [Croceibacterium sp.]|nr:hypothetical protein [Croceibacterium sp.]